MYKAISILFAAAVLAVASQAQIRINMGGGGPNYGLLNRPEIIKELKLTAEQQKKIEAELENQRQSMQSEVQSLFSGGMGQEELKKAIAETMVKLNGELRKKLSKIMDADQLKRFDQVELQLSGVRGLGRENIAKELGLSEDVKKKIGALVERYDEDSQEIMQNAQHETDGNGAFRIKLSEQDEKKLSDLGKKYREEATKLLTDEQKKKWIDMLGPEYKKA